MHDAFHVSGHVKVAIVIAAALWTMMFSPWTKDIIPFWWAMTGSAVILIALSLMWGKKFPNTTLSAQTTGTNILIGIGIAAALWGVFWVGDKLSQCLFGFARPQVDTIYQMKDGWNPVLVSGLLLCIIGPAEELFWRRFVQGSMGNTWQAAIVTLAAYTLVHIASLNFMLIMSAMVCGIVWGGLYYLMPKRFGAILISHALWDAAVFVWFPI